MKNLFYPYRNSLTSDLDALFSESVRLLDPFVRASSPCAPEASASRVSESDDAYRVELDLPGVRREDVEVDAEDGVLRVSSLRRSQGNSEEAETGDRKVLRYRLPEQVDVEGISASLEHGVLTLTVPKAAAAKPLSIEVK